jgi:hypothetical protein
MINQRFMLCEDADTEYARLIQAGLDKGVPPPLANEPPDPRFCP